MGSELTDRVFLKFADLISASSKDPSTKCGAVIVSPGCRILGHGANNFPPGIAVDDRMKVREIKYELIVHAELAAILSARSPLLGTTIYVTSHPCCRCAAHIVQAGISRVVMYRPTADLRSRWGRMMEMASGLFAEAGVIVGEYDG